MEKLVNIGQSIDIKGELHGKEDLTVEGKVQGKITLKEHSLTIGANGRIQGEVFAKNVMVLGELTGNIVAEDRVEVSATGSMQGDIIAPRVVLADGARFKGSIDMEGKARTPTTGATVKEPAAVGDASRSVPGKN